MFEIGKTYKTRDDRDAKLLHRFPDGHRCPLLWVSSNGLWTTTEEGEYWDSGQESSSDIIPPIRVGYVNVYNGHYGNIRPSRAEADKAASEYHGRTACVRVEYHEGQFDE